MMSAQLDAIVDIKQDIKNRCVCALTNSLFNKCLAEIMHSACSYSFENLNKPRSKFYFSHPM